jgi:S-adenosylmethionine:tRNA ribosyltransferase-isomerase
MRHDPGQVIADTTSVMTEGIGTLDFQLPPGLEAGEPPEARGIPRDGVRLLISHTWDDTIEHSVFRNFPDLLDEGDVVVVNTSGTMNAALDAMREDGTKLELHLSTGLPAGLWIVELRRPDGAATVPFHDALPGETLILPGGGSVAIHRAYSESPGGEPAAAGKGGSGRLWIASLSLPLGLHDYLNSYGFPIRYGYVRRGWPIDYYRTVYQTEPGSAEMPSAGRAFTPEIITRLVARGVQVVPLLLHTGVASLEEHEPPYEEFYRVPEVTADVLNRARAGGRRLVAVGTTVVRALETVTNREGITHPGEGWTRLIVTPERRIRSVNALLTGFHEPRATHLAMLAALAGIDHLRLTYREPLRAGYLWHEFGDLHLIVA